MLPLSLAPLSKSSARSKSRPKSRTKFIARAKSLAPRMSIPVFLLFFHLPTPATTTPLPPWTSLPISPATARYSRLAAGSSVRPRDIPATTRRRPCLLRRSSACYRKCLVS
ncbi:hypothetical protein GQ55_1G150500 [Panicum hallii var. hallii]|uniref:Uncharacterized protein n=1 Tax=Panicum hallii var. hallii TaxID=1504633 RepID=A0A2T7F5H4_9POAL|nr:hypothetical protein GQ55_1G150500 [Panicum hallii var. hallii]